MAQNELLKDQQPQYHNEPLPLDTICRASNLRGIAFKDKRNGRRNHVSTINKNRILMTITDAHITTQNNFWFLRLAHD